MPSNRLSGTLERIVERTRRGTMRLAASFTFPAGGRIRPTAGGGLLVILASVAASLASAPLLGDSVRIRWSVGTYYGPEHAPTTVALAAFPALVALISLGSRALAGALERAGAFDPDLVRELYELSVLVTLTALVVAQIAFVVANLL